MKILLAMKAALELRSLSGVVSMLTERGHDVHLLLAMVKTADAHATLERWAAEEPRLTFEVFPPPARTRAPTVRPNEEVCGRGPFTARRSPFEEPAQPALGAHGNERLDAL